MFSRVFASVCFPAYETHIEKEVSLLKHQLNFIVNFVQHYISMMIKEHQGGSHLSEQTNKLIAGSQDLLKEFKLRLTVV